MGLLRRRSTIKLPAHGGDVRPSVRNPAGLRRQRSRQIFAATAIKTAILALMGLNVAMAYAAVGRMDADIYVADGSRFGCLVEPYEVAGLAEDQP